MIFVVGKTYRWFIFGILLMWFFVGCKKSESERQEPFFQATIRIANNDIPSDATVEYYVFDNEEDFKSTASSGVPIHYTLSGKWSNNKLEISKLPSGKDQYLYVRYYDTISYPGYSLLYTNEESTYFLPAARSQSQVQGTLKLKPQDGIATFQTSSENAAFLPFTVYRAGIPIATINEVTSSIDAPHSIKMRKGNYIVQSSSSGTNSCVWIKTFSIVPGKVTEVRHEACEVGQVIFYTNDPQNLNTIVKIGLKEQIGTLGSIGQPVSCASSTHPHATLPKGSYTYHAYNDITKCAWTDTFSVKSGVCKMIPLSACTP